MCVCVCAGFHTGFLAMGGKSSRASTKHGNVRGSRVSPLQICFVEFCLSEVDFRYRFDAYTHAAVHTFWVHDAIPIENS